jgi:hypothetical protein
MPSTTNMTSTTNTRTTVSILSACLVLAVSIPHAMAQCTKDTDCKGNRICEQGRCATVGAPSRPAPTMTVAARQPVSPSSPTSSASAEAAPTIEEKATTGWFRGYASISSQIGASGWGSVFVNDSGHVDRASADLGVAVGTRIAGLGVIRRRFHLGGFFSYLKDDLETISFGLSMKFGGQLGDRIFLSGVIDLGYQRMNVFNGLILFPRAQIDILTIRAGGFKWALFGSLGTEVAYGRAKEDSNSVHYCTIRPMVLLGTTFGG